MVLGAYLYGLETVGECLKDETVSRYLKHCIFEEIVPTLGNTQTDIDFGKAVFRAFRKSVHPSHVTVYRTEFCK